MNLAQQLALDIADGRASRLPRLTRSASPEFARDLLVALYELRDRCAQLRRDEGATWTLRDRIAFASVVQEVEGAILDASAWLSRMARRGGRGVPLPPVGRDPGAGRSPAVDGPWMARSGGAGIAGTVAAGAAPRPTSSHEGQKPVEARLGPSGVAPITASPEVAGTTPGDPLFAFAREGSSCHRLQPGATLKAAQEAACT